MHDRSSNGGSSVIFLRPQYPYAFTVRPGFQLRQTLCLRAQSCSPPQCPHSIALDRLL
ncbi:hypothetical protein IEO21_09616 [Rhodonia placenta]|uniref:Uncharacterized protein n=1 Tax=Rhodonia placenta TaxID=104341 RepID=A0A8H7NU47_9APHY|nr:hypothetical protein IEO21_09616 [Postia placenta]